MNARARDRTPDPYRALGVSPDASQDEIKKAYRRLARECHPDRTGGDASKEARFKEVSTAYDILGDPEKRAQYDAMRNAPLGGGGAGGGFGGGIFDLGDLFAQMFGDASAASGRGGGVEFRAYSGGNEGGFGFDPGDFGAPFGPAPGPRSRPRKAASRSRPAERKVRAADGSPLLQRGSDVYSDLRLRFDQAVLGTVAEVPTTTGVVSVKVPPGTSSGVKLRLEGKGVERAGRGRGDHFVTVHIDAPKTSDDEAKRLLASLMQRLRKDEG